MLKFLFLVAAFVFLNGCVTEPNYRGVPEGSWNQLSPEQKQLIVDKSFHDEMN